jgi:hypothetical protein
MNGPAAESQADRVEAAAEVIRQRSLVWRVEQKAVANADCHSSNQQASGKAEVPARISDDGKTRWRGASGVPAHDDT